MNQFERNSIVGYSYTAIHCAIGVTGLGCHYSLCWKTAKAELCKLPCCTYVMHFHHASWSRMVMPAIVEGRSNPKATMETGSDLKIKTC